MSCRVVLCCAEYQALVDQSISAGRLNRNVEERKEIKEGIVKYIPLVGMVTRMASYGPPSSNPAKPLPALGENGSVTARREKVK